MKKREREKHVPDRRPDAALDQKKAPESKADLKQPDLTLPVFLVKQTNEKKTHKDGAGGRVGFNLAVGQRPPGLVEVSGHSAGRPVSRCAAQVAVGAQRLSRAVADLQVEKKGAGFNNEKNSSLDEFRPSGASDRSDLIQEQCGTGGELAVPYHCAGLRVLAGAPGQDGRLRTGHRFRVALLEAPKPREGKRHIERFLKKRHF